ncbi:MAG: hypothetical protein HZA66_03375 [Rhodopseudomonas palustris]|uniref:Uncharacterized protein n=1 Tax=Rhodopseudomonas palustris TaxID=1076 RepID=A0A933RUF5_RHOPL|nr:hypothetical protein [Rhodopseudomonas palustris]
MANLAILALLAGAVFGMRFNILVLFPLSIFVGVNTIVVGLILGHGIGSALLGCAIVILAMQGGYVLGSLTRWTVAAARAGRTGEAHAGVRVRET